MLAAFRTITGGGQVPCGCMKGSPDEALPQGRLLLLWSARAGPALAAHSCGRLLVRAVAVTLVQLACSGHAEQPDDLQQPHHDNGDTLELPSCCPLFRRAWQLSLTKACS